MKSVGDLVYSEFEFLQRGHEHRHVLVLLETGVMVSGQLPHNNFHTTRSRRLALSLATIATLPRVLPMSCFTEVLGVDSTFPDVQIPTPYFLIPDSWFLSQHSLFPLYFS